MLYLTQQERFTLNSESGLPLYLQIAHELIFRIETGALKVGDKLPGIRTLAKELGVSFLTVNKAYAWLRDRRVVASTRGVGVSVVLTLDSSAEEVRQRARLLAFADKVVAQAVQKNMDPMLVAQSITHRALAYQGQAAPTKIVFVECLPEYVDDYTAELRTALADLHLEIEGVLTTSLERDVSRRLDAGKGESNVDLLTTTLYHFDFVERLMTPHGQKVFALSHTLDTDAIEQIVSIPRGKKIGVLFGSVDPAPGIIKMIQFYRDLPNESIPFAIVKDSVAVRKIVEKSDVLIYTASCEDCVAKIEKKKKSSILIRFVPDQEAINKIRMLVKRDKGFWGKTVTP
jgi:DNA-binding transcriptional regulator YhcF (GntR family)